MYISVDEVEGYTQNFGYYKLGVARLGHIR